MQMVVVGTSLSIFTCGPDKVVVPSVCICPEMSTNVKEMSRSPSSSGSTAERAYSGQAGIADFNRMSNNHSNFD